MDISKFTNTIRKALPIKYCGAVIVAAGTASRMGGIDKVMAELGGEPMIVRTVRAFENCNIIREIVIVTRQDLIMKITIELTEQELKDLIFKEEKPKVKYERYTSEEIKQRNNLACVLSEMEDIASLYGLVSVADYKDILSKNGIKTSPLHYKDNTRVWTYRMLKEAKIVRKAENDVRIEFPEPAIYEDL